jgi:hypothetical protein
MGSFNNNILLNLKNIPGWRTRKKILVIECDDWGSIRMPSRKVFELLINKGLNIDTGRFNRYDTLESAEDLELLYDTLRSVRDLKDGPAVFTAVTNMANPDFNRIRSGGFSEYFYEPFTDTLKKYYPDSNVFQIWCNGIKEGLFIPELHGREHISTQLWMDMLRSGNEDLMIAFDQGFVSLDIKGVSAPVREFRAEFYFNSDSQKPFLDRSIMESVSLFMNIFGRVPLIFVPANGIFHPDFDRVVSGAGVRFLYVSNIMPYPVDGGKMKYRWFISGQSGRDGLTYYTRNCAFEPTDEQYKGIGTVLKQIEAAFRWGKPASISTHRVNFVGGISEANREKGLYELKKLLKAIIQNWPEVEFMSAGDSLNHLKEENKD